MVSGRNVTDGYRRPRCARGAVLVLLALAGITWLAACGRAAPPEPILLEAATGLRAIRNEAVELPLPASAAPLLIAIESAGARLDSRVIDTGARPLSRVHFDYLRSVPIYHLIEPAATAGARLRIVAVQAPAGATLSVRIYALPDAAGDGRPLFEAWQALARGEARIDTLDGSAWAANLAALDSARRRFERLDQELPALWAAYLRAYLLYFPLYRYTEAAEAARGLLETLDARHDDEDPGEAYRSIEVLAHQLAGQIRLESDPGAGDDAEAHPLAAARRHFTAARDRAEAAGLPFEEIWAINNLGIAFFYDDQLEQALEHYALALRLAERAADPYLVALIASNVAVARERSGNIDAAVATLERIGQEPAMQDSPLERELVLSLLGNYYLKLYRFPDALDALNEALALADQLASVEARGRNRVMLARAYREMGQPQKARLLVERAMPDLAAVQDRRGLRQAHRLAADLDRRAGALDAMQAERLLEQALLDTDRDRAEWLFSSAEDAAAHGDGPAATALFRDSAQAFAAIGLTPWADLAALNACAAAATPPADSGCRVAQLAHRFENIRPLQASAPALRARFTWARLLAAQGEPDAAREQAAELIDEIRYYRQALPGVLGAWYWDARQEVFAFYLQRLIDASAGAASGRPDVLLALDRLRNATSPPRPVAATTGPDTGSDGPSAGAESAALRTLLAQRDRAATPEDQLRAQRLIDRELAHRRPAAGSGPAPDPAGFLADLERLPPDWSLVAWYLAGPTALAWVGNDAGLQLVELGPGQPILEAADRVRSKLRVHNEPTLPADLAALGERLLRPLQPALRFNVMVASGETLADLPLDALLVDGRPFVDDHQVLHVQSVTRAIETARLAGSALAPRRLFLAGFPLSDGAQLDTLPGTQRELAGVQAAFPLAATAIFEQAALDAEAFGGEAFRSADLVHLASHAVIDRDYPELSRLMISGGPEEGPAFLTPTDLAGTALSARLVVLSACETVGLNRFDFDNRLGFVTALLQQSDALVVASLWPVPDRVTGEFMTEFYRELAATGDVPAALRAAKLRQRRDPGRDGYGWAAFQLFSR